MFTRIYALAVCFATMVIIAVSSGIGLYDLVQVSAPSLTVNSWDYQNLQSNDSYRQAVQLSPRPGLIVADKADAAANVASWSEEELTRRREERLANLIDAHRRDALRSLIQAFIFVLVAGVIFFLHWRLAKRLDQSAGE